MADADLEEFKRLEGALASAEKLLIASPHGVNPVFSSMVDNIRRQLESLEHKIKEKEQENRQQQELAVQRAVERETALNASEKEAYGGFLKEEFFTKADIGRLETFYDKTWDKLTDGGKSEMSHRFWQGIRQNEYTFSDAPDIIKEKEAKFLHTALVDRETSSSDLEKISATDRNDFLRSYESGNLKDAYKILNRDSFRENVSVRTSKSIEHASATQEKANDRNLLADNQEVKKLETPQETSKNQAAKAQINTDSVNLDNLTLKEDDGPVTVANMPLASSIAVKQR